MIFYGSNKGFEKQIPNKNRNLTDLVMELDNNSKKHIIYIENLSKKETKEDMEKEETKIIVDNFVIFSSEYCGVREHVINNFSNFIAQIDIQNMYLQNPPLRMVEQLYRVYGDKKIIKVKRQRYSNISKNAIKAMNEEYDNFIIGQEKAKEYILRSIYPLTLKERTKPVVMLFYGETGIGKTETAHYLAKLLKGKLFRKQFSMYQNNEFATYLFGGKHTESSFAKDLLDRDSNVILLDEFDKANPTFHSAFYQLFDEGVYEDGNYLVDLKKTIIICTSNYTSVDEVRKNLGDAIYNRFDAVIHFENLSPYAKIQIADKIINEIFQQYNKEDVEISNIILERLKENSVKCSNAREIRRLIEDTFSLSAVRKICEKDRE